MSKKATTKTRKRRPNNMPPKTWNLTEIIYAFTGLLTTREKPLIFSRYHDVAPISQMVAHFVVANKLPEVRDKYPNVKFPPGTDHLTNEPMAHRNAMAEQLEPEDAIKKIAAIIYNLDKKRQDLVLATVLEQVKTWRRDRLNMARKQEIGAQIDANTAQDEMNRLENVIRGDFAILYPTKNAANG